MKSEDLLHQWNMCCDVSLYFVWFGSWRHHDMETLFSLLTHCTSNPPVTGLGRNYLSVNKMLNSTGCCKLPQYESLYCGLFRAERLINSSRDTQNCIWSESQYAICVAFTTRLYDKTLKIDFVWPGMANNLQLQTSWLATVTGQVTTRW